MLAAQYPLAAQYCPTAQHIVPHGLSFRDASQESGDGDAAAALVAAKKELYVDVTVVRSVST